MSAWRGLSRGFKAVGCILSITLRQSGNSYGAGTCAVAVRSLAGVNVSGSRPAARWFASGTEVDYSRLVPVTREGGKTVSYNAVWLRENCSCEKCFVWSTLQRAVMYHRLPAEAFIENHVNWAREEGVVEVTWEDGHLSRYNTKWLDSAKNQKPLCHNPDIVPRIYWDSSLSVEDLPKVGYFDLQDEEKRFTERKGESVEEAASRRPALKQLLTNILLYGFTFIDNTPANLDGTMAATGFVSFPQTTLYGERWQFGAGGDNDEGQQLDFADTAYTTAGLSVHTDGTYLSQPPGLQALHLLRHVGGVGGESLLVDGFRAANLLRERDPASFHVLCNTRIEHEAVDHTRHCDYRHRDTVLRFDPRFANMEWIRYNPYDRSAEPVAENLQGPTYEALASLSLLLEDPSGTLKFKLRPGRLLLFDNWRVLHGRTAFIGRRELCGCYMPRDDWLNKARQMALL